MFTSDDLLQLKQKGISVTQAEEQIRQFKEGFAFLPIVASASVEKGILSIPEENQQAWLDAWKTYSGNKVKIVKFVPASGAASRMFKDLFEYLETPDSLPPSSFVQDFFKNISFFAFHNALNQVCIQNEGKNMEELIRDGKQKQIIENLLLEKGLNYGALPKGLLLFHFYPEGIRTSMEEHLTEGALYTANNAGEVHLHFTVSSEHKSLFEDLIKSKTAIYEKRFNIQYNITFSEQKPSTDTLAVDMDNQPFRDHGKLLFRPGGHGALIENLNDIDADVIFIKNIDNIVPDKFKASTVQYKQLIAGVLVDTQQKIFHYLRLIDSGKYNQEQLMEILYFIQNDLCTKNPETKNLEDVELVLYLKSKLNRPIRVCGMVRNEGEPGGGPFLAINPDGTVSPQILESSQINLQDPEKKRLFEQGTHFNPVDLVCAVKNYLGEKFDLTHYIDKNTGFISKKSKNGKDLKALELPGLWNGAMSDWNTVFVEVPANTFNPVKTVNDLLRPEHQG